MLKFEGGFISNLGKVYGLYTLGFFCFVILIWNIHFRNTTLSIFQI